MNDESDTPTAPDGQRGTAHSGTGRGARRGGTGHRRGHGRRGRVRGPARARVWGAVAVVAVLGAGGLGTSLLFGGPTEASAGRPAASVVPGAATVEPLKAPKAPSTPSRPGTKPSPGEPSATAPSPEPPPPAATAGKPAGGTGSGGGGNGTEGAGGTGSGGSGGAGGGSAAGGSGGTGTGGGTGGADPEPAPRDPAPEASPRESAPRATPSRTAGAVTEVAALVNTERNANGCKDITTDARLNRAAEGHSRDMAERDYFDHTSPDGRGVGDRVTAAGYEWSAVGENIAMGQPTAVAVVEAWLDSPGHRANILNCEYTQMGLGVDTSDGGPRWTQVFAAPQ
ncbi:CAP domain-containing protein [Streptomyces uncialis]|uniref:CAP domain-containing protein n=1 Tax=Streptomyces uncialis TaxID=1048205 RepID=UPI0037ABDF53